MGLMDKKSKSRILVRSSNNVYNQSLVSAMINNYGKDNTRKFCLILKIILQEIHLVEIEIK